MYCVDVCHASGNVCDTKDGVCVVNVMHLMYVTYEVKYAVMFVTYVMNDVWERCNACDVGVDVIDVCDTMSDVYSDACDIRDVR